MIDALIEKGFTPHMLARDAVGKAMMVAQARFMQNLDIAKFNSADEGVVYASRGGCLYGSAIALEYLANNYMEGPNKLFTRGCLVIAYNNPNIPFVEKYKNDKHSSYFLVQDIAGYWHAASPANYDQEDETTSMLTPIPPSRSISKVMRAITENDGGDWPYAKYILRKFGDWQYGHAFQEIEDTDDGQTEMVHAMGVYRKDGRNGCNFDRVVRIITRADKGLRLRRIFREIEDLDNELEKHKSALRALGENI